MTQPLAGTAESVVMECVVCPRLCRDACPVSVHAGRDDLVPSEKMRSAAAVFGAGALGIWPERLAACTGCGACTEQCLLSVPVASWLAHARDRSGSAEPPQDVGPDAPRLDAPPTVWLATCADTPPIDARARSLLPADRAQMAPLRRKPLVADDVPEHRPALGSTCCGARLPASVGDPGLRARMARAMLEGVADGAVVAVADAGCACWLAEVACGRVHVGLPAPPRPATDAAPGDAG